MIDTHSHINSKDLVDVKKEIDKINLLSYLNVVINVGLDIETSKECVEIAIKEPKFYSSIGIHPLHNGDIDSLLDLYLYYENSKIVAIGEIGLDNSEDIEKQKIIFIEQIKLANMLELPIIIHSNNTNKEVINIIKENKPNNGFVFHCFQPDIDIMREIISLDGYISVGTPITRPNAKKSLEVVKMVPMERLLIELDYPYMSKDQIYDGKNTFNKIRELRGLSYKKLEEELDNNAKRLFRIK